MQYTEAWKAFVKVIDYNVELLREQLEDPESEDTLEEIRIKRTKILWYRSMRNTPKDVITNFTQPDKEQDEMEEADPYPQRSTKDQDE